MKTNVSEELCERLQAVKTYFNTWYCSDTFENRRILEEAGIKAAVRYFLEIGTNEDSYQLEFPVRKSCLSRVKAKHDYMLDYAQYNNKNCAERFAHYVFDLNNSIGMPIRFAIDQIEHILYSEQKHTSEDAKHILNEAIEYLEEAITALKYHLFETPPRD